MTSLYSFCDPIIVFRNLPVSEMSEFLEIRVDLGQIAKLSPGTLVGYTELGLRDLLPILVFGSVAASSELKVFRAVLYLFEESYADVSLISLLLLLFLESPRSFFRFCLLDDVFC